MPYLPEARSRRVPEVVHERATLANVAVECLSTNQNAIHIPRGLNNLVPINLESAYAKPLSLMWHRTPVVVEISS